MLTTSLIIIAVWLVLFINNLRAIQKNSRSHLEFMTFRRKTMDLLRSDNFKVSNTDYKKLRKIMDYNEHLIEIHSCQRSSFLHIFVFFTSIKSRFTTNAYEYNKIVNSLKPKDERIIELQKEFSTILEWSVFYNTPFLVKILALVMLLSMLISLLTIKATKDYYDWYIETIRKYFRIEIETRYNHIHDFVRV